MTLDPREPATIVAFVREQERAIVATVTPDGAPEAALVGIAALDDGTLIFNAPTAARKIANLQATGRVAVVVGAVGPVSVQIEGDAVITEGDEKAHYADEFENQCPGTRSRYPGYEVIVIRPDWARVYDVSHKPPLVIESAW